MSAFLQPAAKILTNPRLYFIPGSLDHFFSWWKTMRPKILKFPQGQGDFLLTLFAKNIGFYKNSFWVSFCRTPSQPLSRLILWCRGGLSYKPSGFLRSRLTTWCIFKICYSHTLKANKWWRWWWWWWWRRWWWWHLNNSLPSMSPSTAPQAWE